MRNFFKRYLLLALAAGFAVVMTQSIFTTASAISAAGPHVQEMRGSYYGFIQEGDNPVEFVRTDIIEQENRRFSGIVDSGGPHVIDGTVSASGNVNYLSGDGSVRGRAELHEYEGGAAILNGTHTTRRPDGSTIIPCVLQLRSFAGDGSVVPNPAGSYRGTISGGGEFNIVLFDPLAPIRSTSFRGTMEITLDGETHTFQLLGTIRSDGFVVIIGHLPTAGHLIMEATVDPANSAIFGNLRLELGNGSILDLDLTPIRVPTPTPTPTPMPTLSPTPTPTPPGTPTPSPTPTPAGTPTPTPTPTRTPTPTPTPTTPTPTPTRTPTPSPTPTPMPTPTPTGTPTPTPTPTPMPTPVVTIMPQPTPSAATEDQTSAMVFVFTRTITAGTLTVNYSVSGTATPGADFTGASSGTVTFAAGSSTAGVTIDPTTDALVEPNETVIITVSPGAGYSVGAANTSTGTILDDDPNPVVTISANVTSLPEDGPANFTVTATRSSAAAPLQVAWTISGTATVGVDFAAPGGSSGLLTFPAGVLSASFVINPTADTVIEPNETVVVTLSNSSGFTVGSPGSVTLTITDDDTPPLQCLPELLYYKFDGSGTSIPNLASSPPAGTATATINGGQTQGGTAQFGGGLNGSGGSSSTDFVSTGYRMNLTNSNWTISFYIENTGTPTGARYLFGDASASSFRAFYGGAAGANNILLRGGFNDVSAPGAVGTTTSSVVHFVYSTATDDIRAYVNGVLVNTVPQTTVNIMGTGFLKVGGYSTLTGLSSGAAMDEFRLYDRALSAAEVASTYNQQLDSCSTPSVSVTVAPSIVGENGSATLNYTFSRSVVTSQPLTVNFGVGGTAVFSGGIDYTVSGAASFSNTAGTVTFAPGASTAVVVVNPLSDAVAEGNETVILTVVAGGGYNSGSPASATGTIINGDAPS
jgi:outer membrane biosynthesis protein TonB